MDETEIPADAHPDTKLLINALETQDLHLFATNMKNVLELAAFQLCPQIGALKESILEQGAIGAMMSGSGATVFGIFEEEAAAKRQWLFIGNRECSLPSHPVKILHFRTGVRPRLIKTVLKPPVNGLFIYDISPRC